ncbi:NitT/TauT family transport system ATP-binding protein [Cohnella sp. OV330]|uniref:ABC transporter ATP-binding protein n=1 Tax=Cohnella sp. OV330 TaxID=1855288 RepID=UPI0008ECB3E9|nr:ABC transporter ATP-binding protein [Cohnella sp. OV330]SFB02345.1 NitT/TauT family transport system ATP-binding protein [Cohnella sp. OV330]
MAGTVLREALVGRASSGDRSPQENAASQEAPLVVLRDVVKTYANGTVAVSDVNLSIREGDFLSFVGPSGCGKSTLFRIIAGLGRQSEGTVDVFGGDPERSRKQGGVSYVFQDATLMPWANVLDNVTLPLKLAGESRRDRIARAEEALALVGLADYRKALPRQLSGGMRMRVSIARSLISKPRLLLMDEPFGALDEMTRQTLQDELLKIRERDPRLTVLFVTHNVFEAVYLSSRVAVMSVRPGRITEEIAIDVPYPRGEDFRTTPVFSELVRRVGRGLAH